MSKPLYPPSLKEGDKVIIISPSGNTDPVYIDAAKSLLESRGLQVQVSAFAHEKHGRYAGTRKQRLFDLQSAMNDKEIKLIFCSRGGYGIVQLLDYIDFTEIKKHPKWLVGYSDITALHFAFLRNGIASLHAPMARHLTEHPHDEAVLNSEKILFGQTVSYKTEPHILNRAGTVKGRLFGGNMAVMCGLLGTPYFKIPRKGILFIEDIAEAPYKIDRMMWQLKMAGVLKKISGIIIGQFSECEEDPLMEKPVYESIKDMIEEYDYPAAFNFPVGHTQNNLPLIQGGSVILDVKKEFVKIENIR